MSSDVLPFETTMCEATFRTSLSTYLKDSSEAPCDMCIGGPGRHTTGATCIMARLCMQMHHKCTYHVPLCLCTSISRGCMLTHTH